MSSCKQAVPILLLEAQTDSLTGFAGSRNLTTASLGCGHPPAGFQVPSTVALPNTTLCLCEVTLGVVLTSH